MTYLTPTQATTYYLVNYNSPVFGSLVSGKIRTVEDLNSYLDILLNKNCTDIKVKRVYENNFILMIDNKVRNIKL